MKAASGGAYASIDSRNLVLPAACDGARRVFGVASIVLLILAAGCGTGGSGFNPNNVTVVVSPATATTPTNGQVVLQATVTGDISPGLVLRCERCREYFGRRDVILERRHSAASWTMPRRHDPGASQCHWRLPYGDVLCSQRSGHVPHYGGMVPVRLWHASD
jgi:hypothetical protein